VPSLCPSPVFFAQHPSLIDTLSLEYNQRFQRLAVSQDTFDGCDPFAAQLFGLKSMCALAGSRAAEETILQ
jgi:hypothetical protein